MLELTEFEFNVKHSQHSMKPVTMEIFGYIMAILWRVVDEKILILAFHSCRTLTDE